MPLDLKRFRRFSLRTFLIVVSLLAVVLAVHTYRVRQQRRSVAAVRHYGGWVYYDFEVDDLQVNPEAASSVPRFALELLGVDFFHPVVQVHLNYSDHTGQRLDNDNESDEILTKLAGFRKLRTLLMSDSQASDEGLRHIGRLKNLEHLYMWDAHRVSDEGIRHLASLKKLRTVHCNESKITDHSLRVLGSLPSIEKLSLQQNQFSDEGLAHLANSTRLKSLVLGLGECEVTNDGLGHLVGLQRLELLGLQRGRITDDGIPHLLKLKSLKELWVDEQNFSSKGRQLLKGERPKLKVR